MTKPIDLDEAERIGKAANPAPWFHDPERSWDRGGIYSKVDPNGNGIGGEEVMAVSDEFISGDAENGDFIAYARNHWQTMIDELRQARQQVALLERENEQFRRYESMSQQPQGLIRLGSMPHDLYNLDEQYQDLHEDTTIYLD